jgi:uncharacterized protein (TIGR03067 family)
MFRITIRDVLWLLLALAVAVAWRGEIRQRKWELAERQRLQAVIRDQALELDSVEHYLLDNDDKDARPLLDGWVQRRAASREADNGPPGPLAGQWQVVELIEKGKVRDLKQPYEQIKIDRGRITFLNQNGERGFAFRCTVNEREIDLDVGDPFSKAKELIKGIYRLQDGELRIVWADDIDMPRPTKFDALKNEQLTLYVLKREK